MTDEVKNKAYARLMEVRSKPKKTWLILSIFIAVGIVIGVVLGVFSDRLAELGFDFDGNDLILGLFLSLIPTVIIHETGHLVFGLVTGHRLVCFRILFFAFYKREGKLKFGMYMVPGTAGQCLMVPPEGKKFPFSKLMHLGGVLFNLGQTVLFLVILIFTASFLSSFVTMLFAGFVLWGIVFALTNGIPHKNGTMANDGYNARALSRDPAGCKALAQQLRIMEALHEGKRLREMPLAWFLPPEGASGGLQLSSLRALFIDRLLDEGNFVAAEEACFDLVAGDPSITDMQVYTIMTDILFLELVGECRREVVNPLQLALSDFFKTAGNFLSVLRTQVAYHLLVSGNVAEAAKYRNKFEKLIRPKKKYPFTGLLEGERMLFGYMDAIVASRK